jgi:hypothetical protein
MPTRRLMSTPERLGNAVRVLRDKCITLNGGKCQLNMSQVVLMGHVLSDRGVGPAEVKVKAVVEAREPKTAAEVRSFLGLVNYSARFIPSQPYSTYCITF